MEEQNSSASNDDIPTTAAASITASPEAPTAAPEQPQGELSLKSNANSSADNSAQVPAEEAPVETDQQDSSAPSRTLKLSRNADADGDDATDSDAQQEPHHKRAESGGESQDSADDNADNTENNNGRRGRNRRQRNRRDPNTPSANPMSLTDLKNKPTQELIDMAREMGLENMARSRKQDIIFALLKRHAKSGEDIWGDGVLEILQDGFGFLRSADSSYLAGPDDIYVSPSQIRRFNLRYMTVPRE